jgi:hypothetical protein
LLAIHVPEQQRQRDETVDEDQELCETSVFHYRGVSWSLVFGLWF